MVLFESTTLISTVRVKTFRKGNAAGLISSSGVFANMRLVSCLEYFLHNYLYLYKYRRFDADNTELPYRHHQRNCMRLTVAQTDRPGFQSLLFCLLRGFSVEM